jgi:hypothetical protein
MRSMVLNDEEFHAYWCRRELQVSRDPGYLTVLYHQEPRSGAVREREAIARFFDPGRPLGERIDVLVLNRTVDVSTPAAATIRTQRGQRVIYVASTGDR